MSFRSRIHAKEFKFFCNQPHLFEQFSFCTLFDIFVNFYCTA